MPSLRKLLCFTFFVFSCQAAEAQSATPVILISVDTLRADHLGCYQAGRTQSPHIDALAKSGTLFSQIATPFPLTLPAHVSLFTSTYPFVNGVEDNGIPLKPSATTIATVLKSKGYRTGAFVGSFVLDRRFGLSQGFDVYDGPLDVHNQNAGLALEHKRPGGQVAQAARNWLEHNSNGPFFLFLHLYDLHAPYSLPADPSLRHGETGYLAELAYVDRLLGDFFELLERRGLMQKALIVFTSDHGEGLGEHGEMSHGYFIYQSTLHVPLIVHWPAGSKRLPQSRIDEPASLMDVAPTILEAVGVTPPPAMKGRSLMKGGGGLEVYAESLYARNHFGCAALRSMRLRAMKYIDAPKPELYDLSADPNEKNNLYDQRRQMAGAMRERVVAIRGAGPAQATPSPSPDTATVLRSLGYLSGSTSMSRLEPHVDPKDRIADFERYSQALALSAAGNLAQSNALLEPLLDKVPDVVDIRMSVGLNRRRGGDESGAAQEFKRAVQMAPGNASAHFELGSSYFRLRQTDDAIKEFKITLALEPWYTRADEALAEIYIQNKDVAQGRDHLNHLVSVDPQNFAGHFNLGVIAGTEQNWHDAAKHLEAAVRTDPSSAQAHTMLGNVYFQLGDMEKARMQFEGTLRLEPKSGQAHYGLGLVYQKQGKMAEAEREMRAAQASPQSQ